MARHRLERRALDHDQPRLGVEPLQGPGELRFVVAVDEHQRRGHHDIIERIDACAGGRNQVALMVPNVVIDDDRGIKQPGPGAGRKLDPGNGVGPPDPGFGASAQALVHRVELAIGLQRSQLQLDHAQHVGLEERKHGSHLAVVLRRSRGHDCGEAQDDRDDEAGAHHSTGTPVPTICGAQTQPMSA